MARHFTLKGWVEKASYRGATHKYRAMVCPGGGRRRPLGRPQDTRAAGRCGWGHGSTPKAAIKSAIGHLGTYL